MYVLYYNSAIYSSNLINIFINTGSSPSLFNFLIAILLALISLSLNNISANLTLISVSTFKSLIIPSKSSFIALEESISISFPLQNINTLSVNLTLLN